MNPIIQILRAVAVVIGGAIIVLSALAAAVFSLPGLLGAGLLLWGLS